MSEATDEITNTQDFIDIRDVIERVEYLENEESLEDQDELTSLKNLLDECRGNGGDHQWQGDWYPVTLIRDSYFEDYAQEMAEDIGAIASNAVWPLQCIDWEEAARLLQQDYTTADFNGETYWYR